MALALALACGTTAMVEAKQAKKPVIHRTAKKSAIRRGKSPKFHKVKRGKTMKVKNRRLA